MSITLDKALTVFKKLAKNASTKSFAQVFHIDSKQNVLYTNGHILISVDCKHVFTPGTYSLSGQPSQVRYPGVGSIIDSTKKVDMIKDVSSLLDLASLVKPASERKLVIVSDDGHIGANDGINLIYLTLLPTLKVDRITKYGDLYHGIASGSQTSVYIMACISDRSK